MFVDFIIRIAPGIIAAFFGSRWAISKFYAEKSWERKELAYGEIINALYDLIRYFRVHKEDYGQGTDLSSEQESELFQQYIAASSALNKATDIGSFYIPVDAEKLLKQLRTREQLDYYNEPRFEFYEQEYQEHKNALDELMKIAKKDLRIK